MDSDFEREFYSDSERSSTESQDYESAVEDEDLEELSDQADEELGRILWPKIVLRKRIPLPWVRHYF